MFSLLFFDEYGDENDDAEREEEEGTDALLVQEFSPFAFAFKTIEIHLQAIRFYRIHFSVIPFLDLVEKKRCRLPPKSSSLR